MWEKIYSEVEEMIEIWIGAALRVHNAGFDAVEFCIPKLLRYLDGERDVNEVLAHVRLSDVDALRALERLVRAGEVAPLSPNQLFAVAADRERGHVFTDRVLNARGRLETWLIGAETARPFAVVIIGGLVTATMLTLFILPILIGFTCRSTPHAILGFVFSSLLLQGFAPPVGIAGWRACCWLRPRPRRPSRSRRSWPRRWPRRGCWASASTS